MPGEVTVDRKGRVVIPRELREELGLHEGSKVRLALEEKRIVMTTPVSPEEFIGEMEGCVKEGSPIPKMDLLELKGIWEQP
ncbi:MAG: AbrB/MazE/SpoVT family DNA-binding domain-containing protein [Candidatus Bathyarchaeia archaeon]